MSISYEEFYRRINEHALYVGDLSRFDNYLTHVKDEKLILEDLKLEMSKLKEMISHFNWQSIFKFHIIEDVGVHIYNVGYNEKITTIIQKLKDLLEDIENDRIKAKANYIVYGSEDEMNFYITVDIKYKEFNRIHIIEPLPYSFRGIGLGKILYKNIIKKMGWISSQSLDVTEDSKLVWDSLSKDQDLYTCIKDQSIICFDSKLEKYVIESTLKYWLQGAENYVIDTDLLKKYPDFDTN